MSLLTRRSKHILSDPLEWFEQSWPFSSTEHLIRIEESVTDDVYRVRAELPGFEPDKDIRVTADGSTLTISAERETREMAEGRSEFRYGSFSRTRSLPAGAEIDKIKAEYHNGILEVSVPCAAQEEGKEIHIEVGKT